MGNNHTFWTDPEMPFVEMRFTRGSALSYKPHSHKEFCVGSVTEGTVLTTIQDKQHVLSPGQLVLIAPEFVHSCNPLQGTSRSYIMAFLDVQWCLSVQEALFGQQEKFITPNVVVLENEVLSNGFVDLTALLTSDAPVLDKSERLTEFAAGLFTQSCDLAVAIGQAEQHGIIDDVKDYLLRQKDSNITLEELSGIFRCNPYHLLRSFKKIVGITPHAFMLNARIERAKKLLRDGLPPATVAAETGFTDQSHFHKTFRRILAATPRQYQVRPRN